VDRFVGHINLDPELVKAGIEPKEGVNREQPLAERNLRVPKGGAGLIVKRAVANPTEIPLERSIAALLKLTVKNGSEGTLHHHASEPAATGSL
jgi:hypothetical protein